MAKGTNTNSQRFQTEVSQLRQELRYEIEAARRERERLRETCDRMEQDAAKARGEAYAAMRGAVDEKLRVWTRRVQWGGGALMLLLVVVGVPQTGLLDFLVQKHVYNRLRLFEQEDFVETLETQVPQPVWSSFNQVQEPRPSWYRLQPRGPLYTALREAYMADLVEMFGSNGPVVTPEAVMERGRYPVNVRIQALSDGGGTTTQCGNKIEHSGRQAILVLPLGPTNPFPWFQCLGFRYPAAIAVEVVAHGVTVSDVEYKGVEYSPKLQEATLRVTQGVVGEIKGDKEFPLTSHGTVRVTSAQL